MELYVLSSTTTGFPVFSGGQDTFQMSESTRVGHVVTTVSATTQRSGVSLSYYISGGNIEQTFMVNSAGQVVVSKTLDHEQTAFYDLWLETRDNGNPKLSDFIKLEIRVSDENDNTPLFEQNFYNTTVMEEEAAPVTVLTVMAHDPDAGDNGRVTYHLAGGNTHSAFSIDSATGQIRTNIKIDREKLAMYSLEIEAVDHVRICFFMLYH